MIDRWRPEAPPSQMVIKMPIQGGDRASCIEQMLLRCDGAPIDPHPCAPGEQPQDRDVQRGPVRREAKVGHPRSLDDACIVHGGRHLGPGPVGTCLPP